MKKTLLILSLLALSACSGEARVSVGKSDSPQLGEDLGYTPGNYHVYKLCIDGISYLTYADKTIIVQRDKEDKPVSCAQPAEPSVPTT